MYVQRQVTYNPAAGHITVIVDSGYVTQGSFKLSLTDGTRTIPVGEGKFGDAVPDIFLLPIPSDQLPDWMLIIVGSYSPAAGHNQIKLDYIFQQQANKIDSEPVRFNGTYLSTHHDFTF